MAGSPPAPPLLAELTPQQFALWRRHPVSDLVLQHYLPDWRRQLEGSVVERWMQGAVTLQGEQMTRGQLIALYQIEGISLDQIWQLYGGKPALEKHA